MKTSLSKTAISTNSLWMVCKVTWNNKAFHLIAHTNQKMYTISSIWHKNMHQHLFVTILIWCKTPTIFWEESSRKTQSYREQFHLAYCHAIQIFLKYARKMFMNSWLFGVWNVYFSVFSRTTLWTNKHVLCSVTTANCFLMLN